MGIANQHRKGEGSVYWRQSDQRWCATLTLATLDGKRRRVTRVVRPYTDTTPPKLKTDKQQKAEAEKILSDLRRQKLDNGDIPTKTQTLESWMNVWFTTIAVKKIRPKTAATYRSIIDRYIIPAIGSIQLLKLIPAHVRRLEEYITSTPKNPAKPELGTLSSTTAMQAHRILAVALKYAEREGRVLKNVATLTDAPRKAVRTLTVLTPMDAIKVLQTVAGDRLGSLRAANLLTGARQGELLGLELNRVTDELNLSWQLQRLSWQHGCDGKCERARGAECPKRKLDSPANWEHRHITGGLWLSRPKSSAGWRIIPLVEPLKTIIDRRVIVAQSEPNPHELLWTSDRKRGKRGELLELDGSPIDPSRDNAAWHDALKRAEVHDARLHDARHATASLLRKAGVPIGTITKILGHSTAAMSEQYIDYDREQLTEAMTRMSLLMLPQN